MLTGNQISIWIFFIMIILIFSLGFFDWLKKRKVQEYPFVSFIISCYNDGDSIEETIKSILDSYGEHKFEIIVINDKSTDNSWKILKKLEKKYSLRLINNSENIGASNSLNKAAKFAKAQILWRIDADVTLNRGAVNNVLSRMQCDGAVAVSCPYKIRNKGFLGRMQELECNMMSMLLTAYNFHSTVSLWGGCLAIKKSAFDKVGGFSANMLTEDIDLALKLNEQKMKVGHSSYSVLAYSTDTLNSWYHQKIRWVSGGVQCIIKHWKIMLRHPLYTLFLVMFSLLGLLFIIDLFKEILFIHTIWSSYGILRESVPLLSSLKLLWIYYGLLFFKGLLARLYFSFFSLPYTFPMIQNFRSVHKVLYIFPFSLIYWPIYTIIAVIGIIKGFVTYNKLKNSSRAW